MGMTSEYLARVMIASGIVSALLPSIAIAVGSHRTLWTRPAMTPAQQLWLKRVVSLIPRLAEQIEAGNRRAEFNIGRRVIDGRRVRLVLRADVIYDATSSSTQDEPERDAIETS